MDVSHSTFRDTLVREDHPLHSVPSTELDPKSYDHILSVVLSELAKSGLLVLDVAKPCSFWEVEPEVQVQSGIVVP